MRFDLFNANRISHQPEIPLAGSFKTCNFWNLEEQLRLVGNMHLTEEALKQLGIFQEHLAGCPRSQDSSDSKKDTWAENISFLVKAMTEIVYYIYIHTQAYSTCAYVHVCACICIQGIKNQWNENDYKLQIEVGNEVSKSNEWVIVNQQVLNSKAF